MQMNPFFIFLTTVPVTSAFVLASASSGLRRHEDIRATATAAEGVAPLLEAIAAAGVVGVDAAEEEQARVQRCATALSAESKPKQARIPLSGTCTAFEPRTLSQGRSGSQSTVRVLSIHSPDDLLYSMSKGGSNGKVGPFVGKVTQIILDNKAFVNQVHLLGGALTVQLHAEREVLDDSRIRVTFRETAFKIFGWELTRKPTKGQGVWEMLYVEAAGPEGSASLRVMNTPSLFVLRQRSS